MNAEAFVDFLMIVSVNVYEFTYDAASFAAMNCPSEAEAKKVLNHVKLRLEETARKVLSGTETQGRVEKTILALKTNAELAFDSCWQERDGLIKNRHLMNRMEVWSDNE
jgi:hypothetical protein